MLQRGQIPRLAERLVLSDLLLAFDRVQRDGFRGRPRHRMIVAMVWANTLRGQLTSASAVARLTGLSQQTVSRYLAELVAKGILERERRGWSVTRAAFDRPVLRRGKDRAPMDELIGAVHWASAELRKLSKLER